ncbi:MAG TPA: hypothetical protein PKC43_07800 [Phycisphaerales bacterium]|nr:hypothetical protein [Phycisphaerales bacterium]HMP37340.1 hypothetical protein [Phycisphaerales bacterium]
MTAAITTAMTGGTIQLAQLDGAAAQVIVVGAAALLALLAVIFVGVPLLRGLGSGIAWTFRGIGWSIRHVVEFVAGVVGDALRTVGAVIAALVLLPLTLGSVIIGRWSQAGHFASGVVRECKVAGASLYRAVIRRPLRLFLLDGVLEGIEQRVPEALAAAPGPEVSSSRLGQFEGYRIVGTLRPGGSGAKLYVAEPDETLRRRDRAMPELVVIKSFAIEDGSSLPQIVRESRALECAKQMGLVLDHGLDESRFFYVMPYHAGESLGVAVRQLHGEGGGTGLSGRPLVAAVGYVADLVETLASYHRGGLWHKDVKPENIIVDKGRAHLVDLGLVTPLRSAMTLTTHGTEYFRDPEMVRQALRGVKVHQVDGARFDIYGAGAVLYFALENTFPAHGGLSAFARRSPEALRWIVRRAMAEYSKRYESAGSMLDDLRYVLASADPWGIRPADLPSMGGRPAPEAAVAAAMGAVGARGGEVAAPKAPRLRITNWWTGAYAVVDAAETPTYPPPKPDAAAGRLSAAAQLASARQRAEALRERVRVRTLERTESFRASRRGRRGGGPGSPRPRRDRTSAALIATTLFAIALIGGFTLLAFSLFSVRTMTAGPAGLVSGTSQPQRGGAPPTPVASPFDAAPAPQARMLLVSTHPDPSNPAVLRSRNETIDRYASKGWRIERSDVEAAADLALLLPLYQSDPERYLDALEDALERHGYAAYLWVDAAEGSGPSAARTVFRYQRSGRPDAFSRIAPIPPAPPLPAGISESGPTAPTADEAPTVPQASRRIAAPADPAAADLRAMAPAA